MNHIRIVFVFYLITIASGILIFPQDLGDQYELVPPTANNFAYPQSIFVDSNNGHLWIADFSNHRVMRFDVSSLTEVNEITESTKPIQFLLDQNFPNPFNAATQIRFSTGFSGLATLIVYNLLGEKISVLFNNTAHANKTYTVHFDASNLQSGVYLYVLRISEKLEARKMCLVN